MLGKGDYYPGLIPLCYAYLEHIGCDAETAERVGQYLELLRQRASGELPTAAAWMRGFVSAHPEYARDSVVTPGMHIVQCPKHMYCVMLSIIMRSCCL
jgi:glutamate--cysteine ligase catalytic subunit